MMPISMQGDPISRLGVLAAMSVSGGGIGMAIADAKGTT